MLPVVLVSSLTVALVFAGYGELAVWIFLPVIGFAVLMQVPHNRRCRRAVEDLRTRAPQLTPAERAAELRALEAEYGALTPYLRSLRAELSQLPGGAGSTPSFRERFRDIEGI